MLPQELLGQLLEARMQLAGDQRLGRVGLALIGDLIAQRALVLARRRGARARLLLAPQRPRGVEHMLDGEGQERPWLAAALEVGEGAGDRALRYLLAHIGIAME